MSMVAIAFEPLKVQLRRRAGRAFGKSPAVERWRYAATSISYPNPRADRGRTMRLVPALLTLAVLACARASSDEAAASTPVIVTARPCATGDTAYFGRTARSAYEPWYGGTLDRKST